MPVSLRGLDPVRLVRQALTGPPLAGHLRTRPRSAVDNARHAVLADQLAADQRRDAALLQARALGPRSWTPLEPDGQTGGHAALFYPNDAVLLSRLTSYVGGGLADDETCLVLATSTQLAGLRQSLGLAGLWDSPDQGRLVTHDATELLEVFLRDDWPDPELFDRTVGELVRGCLEAGKPVRAFDHLVGILATQGDLDAAMQVEKLWGALHRTLDFPLLCTYPEPEPEDDETHDRVCDRHTHLAGVAGT